MFVFVEIVPQRDSQGRTNCTHAW